MENIIVLKGNVKYSITLDPGVWILDDRKVSLDTFFDPDHKHTNDQLTEYKKAISRQWDREISEGAAVPPTITSERKFIKEKLIHGSFGIPLKPFLKNAEPEPFANSVIIETKDREVEISLSNAYELILGFSYEGKPLSEDGPIYVYYGDGSNKHSPIKNVTGLRVN